MGRAGLRSWSTRRAQRLGSWRAARGSSGILGLVSPRQLRMQPKIHPWTTRSDTRGLGHRTWLPVTNSLPVRGPLASWGLRLGFKEAAEGGPDLRDHVGGGGGAAVLLEGLPAALPRERARAHGGQEERAGPGEGRPSAHAAHSSFPPFPGTPNSPLQVCCAWEAEGGLATRKRISLRLENRAARLPLRKTGPTLVALHCDPQCREDLEDPSMWVPATVPRCP